MASDMAPDPKSKSDHPPRPVLDGDTLDSWVERQSNHLMEAAGLSEEESVAVSVSQAGGGWLHVAKYQDISIPQARTLLERAEDRFPGITDDRPENLSVFYPDRPSPTTEGRECPVCLKDRVCGVWEAKQVFKTSGWGATSMLEDATLVCSYCHSVRVDGTWQRMETADSRAYKLAQASSSKRTSDYREILTRGIETGKQNPEADDADGW